MGFIAPFLLFLVAVLAICCWELVVELAKAKAALSGASINPTALSHETLLRVIESSRPELDESSRIQFAEALALQLIAAQVENSDRLRIGLAQR